MGGDGRRKQTIPAGQPDFLADGMDERRIEELSRFPLDAVESLRHSKHGGLLTKMGRQQLHHGRRSPTCQGRQNIKIRWELRLTEWHSTQFPQIVETNCGRPVPVLKDDLELLLRDFKGTVR